MLRDVSQELLFVISESTIVRGEEPLEMLALVLWQGPRQSESPSYLRQEQIAVVGKHCRMFLGPSRVVETSEKAKCGARTLGTSAVMRGVEKHEALFHVFFEGRMRRATRRFDRTRETPENSSERRPSHSARPHLEPI